jgi:hypothetical protein
MQLGAPCPIWVTRVTSFVTSGSGRNLMIGPAASSFTGNQAQRFRERAEGRGYLSPEILDPACLMLACPRVAANHAGVRRVGAVVEGDGDVIARPPVDRDVEGLLDIKPGQVARAGHAAADDVEQCRAPRVVRGARPRTRTRTPGASRRDCAGNRAGPRTRERPPSARHRQDSATGRCQAGPPAAGAVPARAPSAQGHPGPPVPPHHRAYAAARVLRLLSLPGPNPGKDPGRAGHPWRVTGMPWRSIKERLAISHGRRNNGPYKLGPWRTRLRA